MRTTFVCQLVVLLLLLSNHPTAEAQGIGGAAETPESRQRTASHLSTELPWYRRSLVGLEVGPTGAQFGHSDPTDAAYCSRFEGQVIVRESVRAGSEYLVIWARDGDYAYYDSKILPKAPGLGSRDVLRETVAAARRHRLPVIAYCVVQQGGHFLEAHPEWEMRGPDGKPIGRFCFNSGYLDAMKDIVAEQLDYGIDGFHIDMLDQGFGPPYGCWCESCQKQFRKQFGHDMPVGATWDESWDEMLEFRYATSQRFEQALTRHIKSINSAATVDYNYHGNPPFSFEVGQRPVQHAGNADFVTGETGVWGFSALAVGLNAEFYRATDPELPFQVAMQRGVRMYHDQTTRPLNDLRWELFTLLSHGAFVTIVDKTAFDGALDSVAYDRFRDCFAEVQEKRTHFGHRPVFDVGIYFSSRTRDWYGRENPAKHFQSFQGAHRACALEHLQFGIVFDENVTLRKLQQFPVILLPNVAIVSNREVQLLTDYVRGGGKLIVTGQPAQRDRLGHVQKRSLLEELIGAKVVRQADETDNWLRLPSAKAAANDEQFAHLITSIPADWPFLVEGPATVYGPTSADSFGQLIAPHRTARQRQGKMGTQWPMSPDQPVGPAVLLNSFGKGQVLTFAASPDFATASEHPIVEARQLLRNAISMMRPEPRLRIAAPATVECVVTDDPNHRKLRVHFIAYNPTPQTTAPKNRPYAIPGLIEDVPIFRTSIQVSGHFSNVTAVNPDTKLSTEGQTVNAQIEDIHEVIVIDY